MFGSMESKEAFLSKLMETRSTILEKAKENISAAQEKQKKTLWSKICKSSCLQAWSKGACQGVSTSKAKRWKAWLPLAWAIHCDEESWKRYVTYFIHFFSSYNNHFDYLAKLTYLTLLFTTGIYLLQENFTLQERRVNGAHIKPFYWWNMIRICYQKGLLQDPLLGEMLDFDIAPDESVQILHSDGDHWITISTVGTKHPKVKVYDSLYNKLPWGTKEQITALLQTEESAITLEYANCQVSWNYYPIAFSIVVARMLCWIVLHTETEK